MTRKDKVTYKHTQQMNFCRTLYLFHTRGRNEVKAVTLSVRNPRKLNVNVVAKQHRSVLTVLMTYKTLTSNLFHAKS
jgi:hypothetical protein